MVIYVIPGNFNFFTNKIKLSTIKLFLPNKTVSNNVKILARDNRRRCSKNSNRRNIRFLAKNAMFYSKYTIVSHVCSAFHGT